MAARPLITQTRSGHSWPISRTTARPSSPRTSSFSSRNGRWQRRLRKLAEYEQLLARVDELVSERDGPADALLAVRLRQRDVLLNMAVANQAQASTAVLTRSNADLIRALRSAETTAHAALGSAQMAGRDGP